MNIKKLKLIILFYAFLLFIFSCNFFYGPGEEPAGYETFQKQEEENSLIKYHSAKEAGKWKTQAADHTPEFKVIFNDSDKKNKIINVNIPFAGTPAPLHYIEVIILADHNHNELQKVEFPIGNKSASAVFRLPRDYKSYVYLIAKCNLHDMWETRVDW